MGLLLNGEPLLWADIRKKRDSVHTVATAHILRVFEKYNSRTNDLPLWGDEVSSNLLYYPLVGLQLAPF